MVEERRRQEELHPVLKWYPELNPDLYPSSYRLFNFLRIFTEPGMGIAIREMMERDQKLLTKAADNLAAPVKKIGPPTFLQWKDWPF